MDGDGAPEASPPHGLTDAEADARRAEFGRNELPQPRTRNILRIIADNHDILML